tara:strand:+ start:1625 stop:1867 length:243 start_codon:yes stop_codon:yes gene_type:complete
MDNSNFDPKSHFGARLRTLRLSRGLTQEALAAKAGIDRTYISSCERGKRNITLEVLYRLSEALRVSPKDLLPDQFELEGI